MSRALDGLHFVITGTFGEDRASIVKKLASLGAIQHSTLKDKTNLLIVGDDPGDMKIKKAKMMGIATADRAWLVRALAIGGFTLKDARIQVENA